ncbi:MAG: bifunctional metallophosphatase/5'-nucleotidase [Myxococcales bacterium]|nr:bifunctional metallophosphatase/5'-nucleotidase [Myxococcales bacterium]
MAARARLCGWWLALVAPWAVWPASGCGDDDSGGDADVADTGADADADADADVEPDVEPDADVGPDGDGPGDVPDGETTPPRRLTILHTNDMHAHLMGTGPELEYTPLTTGDDPTVGGAARLAALIAQRRSALEAAGHDVIVTDSGDFSMGTLFSILDEVAAPSLQFFEFVGYDAITIGNHEFDWTPAHLAATIAAGVSAGFHVPILATNMVTDAADPGDDDLEELVSAGAIVPTATLDLPGGLRVGLLSWLGENAAEVAPLAAPVTFDQDLAHAQAAAAALRAGGADVVVALTHIGLPYDQSDDDLAAAAPDIDIIVGGHSHDALAEVRVPDGTDTLVVQAGSYTRFLGELTVEIDGGAVRLVDYTLHEIDDTIAGDATVQGLVEMAIDGLDDTVLGPMFGTSYRARVAETAFPLATPGFAESNLGDLVTDAFRTVAAAVTPGDPVVAAFESDGVIRDDLLVGDEGVICFADLMRVLPLGIGPDRIPGYPLVSFWVDALELRAACEVSASLAAIGGSDYWIQFSGLRCHSNPAGPFLGRVDGVFLGNERDGYSPTSLPLDGSDTNLYRIAVDYYVASLMSLIESMTLGGLSITPKRADGSEVTNLFEMLLDRDPTTPSSVEELKLWMALWQYVRSLPDGDGDTLPEIPAAYATPLGRWSE